MSSEQIDEFDEIEESLQVCWRPLALHFTSNRRSRLCTYTQSYKRFTKRMRETIWNPLFVGMSFAIGLSLGKIASQTACSWLFWLFLACFKIAPLAPRAC